MELKIDRLLLTIIAATFPGGTQQFKKEKGTIITIGHPSQEIVVFHPGVPDKVKEEFDKMSAKHACKIVYMEHPNFEGLDVDEAEGMIAGVLNFFLETNPDTSFFRSETSNLLIFSLPSVKSEEEDVLELVFAFLRQVEGLNLCYVVVKDASFKITSDAKPVRIDTNSKIVPERTEHGIISKDDVTDICIDIERANTVEDFLKNL